MKDTLVTPRIASGADATAMRDQAHVKVVHVLGGDEWRQVRMSAFRRCSPVDQPESARESMNVCVHGEGRQVTRKQKHAGCRLGPDSGKGDQDIPSFLHGEIPKEAQVHGTEPAIDLEQGFLDMPGFAPGKSGRPNGLFQCSPIGDRDVLPGAVARLQAAKGLR